MKGNDAVLLMLTHVCLVGSRDCSAKCASSAESAVCPLTDIQVVHALAVLPCAIALLVQWVGDDGILAPQPCKESACGGKRRCFRQSDRIVSRQTWRNM